MRRLLLVGLLLRGACSSPKPAADADLGAVADQAMADSRGAVDLTASPDLLAMNDLRTVDLLMTPDFGPDYPAGPYGTMVGDTLTPMVWEGYVNASAAGLASWVNGANLTVTTLRDPDGVYPQSDRGLETRELSLIIDLRTMKIVARFFGSYGGGQASVDALSSAIADVIRRLGS